MRLEDRLPANNKEPVMNKEFKKWEKNILVGLRGARSKSPEDMPDKQLYKICREHAENYRQEKDTESTVMLTHPFYLHLSHEDLINKYVLGKEADEYLENLMELVENNDNIVVLDTIHHYAAATSLLVENGIIDRVIFTENDDGKPHKMSELKDYSDKQIYFGGCYNEDCLNEAIRNMKEVKLDYGGSFEDIMAIKELVLNHPNIGRLKPEYITGVDKSVSLENVMVKYEADF